jgi:hypothetical protein
MRMSKNEAIEYTFFSSFQENATSPGMFPIAWIL